MKDNRLEEIRNGLKDEKYLHGYRDVGTAINDMEYLLSKLDEANAGIDRWIKTFDNVTAEKDRRIKDLEEKIDQLRVQQAGCQLLSMMQGEGP